MALAHREVLLMHYISQWQMFDAKAPWRCLYDVENCVNSIRELMKELLLLDLARYLSFGWYVPTSPA